jgi:DNA-binding GntR family transcriptional regulator
VTLNLSPVVTQPKKLSDHVYSSICDAIIEGGLSPGQRLREAQVATALGVSRTPVREAFARLVDQHLVVRDASGAYLVARWNRQVLWEVATLRGALEGLAVSLAAENLSPKDFDHLEGLILQMEAAVKRQDYERLMSLDLLFHSHIWSRTGHELLEEALAQMRPQIRHFMAITRPGDEEGYPATHRLLIDILRRGDAKAARAAIREHTLSTAEQAITRLGTEGQNDQVGNE